MLTKIIENELGVVFHSDSVPNDLFNFYILRRRSYKDGTYQWNICCELKEDSDKYMVIESIKGTREIAIQRLKEILK